MHSVKVYYGIKASRQGFTGTLKTDHNDIATRYAPISIHPEEKGGGRWGYPLAVDYEM